MSHVAPHRLAELAAGSLGARAAARARRHLDGCPQCTRAFERVKSGRSTFPDLAALPAPELRWDKIRAQTYWTIGSASHTAIPLPPARSRPRWAIALPAFGLAAAAAVALAMWKRGPAEDRRLAIVAPAIELSSPAPAAPAALVGVVTLVEEGGAIATADGRAIVGGNAIGAHAIGPGDRITTGAGRLSAQFGAGSTFTVGPHSTLTMARFDRAAVELALGDAGRVDVEVSHRAPDQRFTVRAGERVVEVRGTAFRVERTGATVAVACEHGRVAVSSDGAPAVELGAGQALAVDDRDPLLGRAARPMTEAELAELLAARPAALPQWTDPDTIYRSTTGVSLVAPAGHTVALDGVAVGLGSLWRRVPPGRHLVESTDGAGRTRPGQWIEIDGAAAERPIVLASAGTAEPALSASGTAAARKARLVELSRAIDQTQLRGCVRSLAKQGLADGTHVELEIGVQASGAMRYLNIVDTDLPDGVVACVRDVVGATRLGAGAQVSWRHRIAF